MFYLNEEKLKEYSVVNYLKSEKFRTQIRPKLIKLIKNEGRDNSFTNLFNSGKQITDPLSLKLDSESLQQINKYASYLGKGSEFFIEKLTEYYSLEKKTYLNPIELRDSGEIIKETTQETRKYFQSKKVKTDSGIGFYELTNLGEYKYSFFFEREEFEKNENNRALISIMNHFKDFLPQFKDCITGEKFAKQYHIKPSFEHKNECELTQWEFDFYNPLEYEVIELKFQKKGWELNGLGQTLLYVYLVDFYYALRVQRIRIINTFAGQSLSISLSDLFIENGQEEFYKLLKREISDYEKLRFMNRILSSFRDGTVNSNLEEIICNNFFCKASDPYISRYCDFIQELNKYRERKDFLSKIHSASGIGSQGVKFLAQKQ